MADLVSRGYQEELAQYARENNAILVAETGTGKTLIATMVVKWKMALEKMAQVDDASVNVRKVSLFLVPKVPLVEQQKLFLEENTTLQIRGYTGAMGVDLWDRTAWQKEFAEADVLVMTSQIFLSILRHAHWDMRQVSVIVFDEIHNCKGKSPEAQIMSEHYHKMQPGVPKPKILGLTASPIFDHKNPGPALTKIEKLTDSKVFVVKEHSEELARFTYQAADTIVDYARAPTSFPSYQPPSLWDALHATKYLPNDYLFPDPERGKVGERNRWYRNLKNRFESTIVNLGPFAADVFVLVHMTTSLDALQQDLSSVAPNLPDPDAKKRQRIQHIRLILAEHSNRLATEGPEIPDEWMSDKLLKLKSLLLKQDLGKFRGIIFTYERQVASTLSLMFPRLGIPHIIAGPFVGHGQSACSEPTKIGMKGMAFRAQERIVDDFREGKLNLLIATSVAEEGLDFPLCSFVCRFDPPRTLPQYIQSRGRARKANSAFIIMLEDGHNIERVKVTELQLAARSHKEMYKNNMDRTEDDLNDEPFGAGELDSEDRFVVEKTGAVLTSGGAISLLNNLCSLIPRDPHTPPLRPKYKVSPIDFTCEVQLPSALPIPREDLIIRGRPYCRTKKAGKRSGAFNAVKRLYELDVFDNYLLPVRREKGDVSEDIDGKQPVDVSGIEPLMDVLVWNVWGDLWKPDAHLYVHRLVIDGKVGMGLVTACELPPHQGMMTAGRKEVVLDVHRGIFLELDEPEKVKALELMNRYTTLGIQRSITRKGLSKPLSLFLVPLDGSSTPDWLGMEHALNTPAYNDWRAIDMSSDVLVSLINGTSFSRLVASRPDLKARDLIAHPDPVVRRSIKNLIEYHRREIPEDDVVLQCHRILCTTSTEFRDPKQQKNRLVSEEDCFLPQSLCQWVNFSPESLWWFSILPPLTRLLSCVGRASALQRKLQLTSLDLNRTIEALMLPSANASFSNQRLETLGDAFLKLATTVHVFNKHPHKHEGQLSVLRQNSVCNRYLLGRGHILDLSSFMTIEPNNQARWRLSAEPNAQQNGDYFVKREIPRRSVQDCMEAMIAVGYLSGGVEMALAVGTKLGLCFGGTDVWWERYLSDEMDLSNGSPFPALETALKYTFKNKQLLFEALTHPSFNGDRPSYQRLEYLGDAIFDLVTMDYFFHKFPHASSGKLSRARARCICNPTLSAIGTKKLRAHKELLCASASLSRAMNAAASQFETMDFPEVIDKVWKLDSPKALSDVVESLLGAVFVDSGWRYDVVRDVALHLLQEALEYVHVDMPSDPTSEFLMWVGRRGCTQVCYRKASSSGEPTDRKDQLFVVVHGKDVGPPAFIQPKTSVVLARATVSENARTLLEDSDSEFFFDKLCACTNEERSEGVAKSRAAADLVFEETHIDNETVEGFAVEAQDILWRMGGNPQLEIADAEDEAGEDEEFALERQLIEERVLTVLSNKGDVV